MTIGTPNMAVPAARTVPGSSAVAVELIGVSKWFAKGRAAVRNVSLCIPEGRLTSLLGPSGSGKSTLLRLIVGLDKPEEGRICIQGRDVTQLAAQHREVGLVLQHYALFPHMSVLANVAYGLAAKGQSETERTARAHAVLQMVGLQSYGARSPASLSGGQQQRVALARALAAQPRLLLLDEPLTSVDAGLRRQLREQIRQLQRALELTVVYVTHDEAEAMAVSDHLVVMHEGMVLQAASPRETYLQPANEVVASLMGDATFLEARVLGPGVVSVHGQAVAVRNFTAKVGEPVTLLVRPEAWQVLPSGNEGFAGKVLERSYQGRVTEYLVQLTWADVRVAIWGPHPLLQRGSPVTLSLKAHCVHVTPRLR